MSMAQLLQTDTTARPKPRPRGRWLPYLLSLPAAPVLIIKEPKTTTVSGIWFEAARQAGFDVAAVVAVRHPDEIIGCLEKRANQQKYVDSSP